MRLLLRLQWPLLILAIAGTLWVCGWRAMQIREMYVNKSLRESVSAAFIRRAQREGWLVSDMLLQSVNKNTAAFVYRQHHRGTDEETCYQLGLEDSSLQEYPCD
jgi:hypothetical protein